MILINGFTSLGFSVFEGCLYRFFFFFLIGFCFCIFDYLLFLLCYCFSFLFGAHHFRDCRFLFHIFKLSVFEIKISKSLFFLVLFFLSALCIIMSTFIGLGVSFVFRLVYVHWAPYSVSNLLCPRINAFSFSFFKFH